MRSNSAEDRVLNKLHHSVKFSISNSNRTLKKVKATQFWENDSILENVLIFFLVVIYYSYKLKIIKEIKETIKSI